nr:MAG TPA: hypothetical protein [Caudoviricetes sp.]
MLIIYFALAAYFVYNTNYLNKHSMKGIQDG